MDEAVMTFVASKGLDNGCYDRLMPVHDATRRRILDQDHWPYSTDNNKTAMAMIATVEDERRGALDALLERWLRRPLD
eukprot:8311609-Alexandrium_andersonii.AAC.1